MAQTKISAAPTSKLRKVSEHHRAFTLLELLVVLAISVALAASVAVNMAGPYGRARAEQSIAELISWLSRIRESASHQSSSCRIQIDLSQGFLQQRTNSERACRPFMLPEYLRIKSIRFADRISDCGIVTIPLTTLGCTPSFALELVSSSGKSQWLFIVGGSGQILQLTPEEFAHVFKWLAPRPDTG
jgi:prepilin-type N-terminal cleavage/methylation domain-containing protein